VDMDTATDVGTAIAAELVLVIAAGVDTAGVPFAVDTGVALAIDTGVGKAVDAGDALAVDTGVAFAVEVGVAFAVEVGVALAADKVADLNVGLGFTVVAALNVAVGCAGARAGACTGAWTPGVVAPLSLGGVGEP